MHMLWLRINCSDGEWANIFVYNSGSSLVDSSGNVGVGFFFISSGLI